MNPLRLIRLVRARRRRRFARAARALRKADARRQQALVTIAGQAQLWVGLAKLAADKWVALRTGDCVICGRDSIVVLPIAPVTDVAATFAARSTATCPTCQTCTVMLGATHAGR